MKIVVIGGTGLIGSKVVEKLRAQGHDAIAASPASGVDTLTGEGLAAALADASVVVDVSNSPSFEDRAVMAFFETSTRNLLEAESFAGVSHHVALSVVGTDRLPDSGYFRAKLAQETLIRNGPIPHTIVRATQFFEFLGRIAQIDSKATAVTLSPAYIQPMASDDVAAAVADAAAGTPAYGVVEVAGPERVRLSEIVQRLLRAKDDSRRVIPDLHARYFGAELDDRSLVPGAQARIAATRFEEWLVR
ncbi:hypothetical protein DSM104443_02338 [Usitatibacter rugosus]|uniref:NAD(P)-binding domain-containing protein n=1 Tax=Usitatibacter rugosus TaxID=2732067 RepID=A0A6M4GW81_9PROT|nr:SDR family oxidoreductase [Usitatibacter rugosus]QJR11265.1 hypothetical protein DSM104443_02338 [Usitatibacter rugosus]